MLMEFRRVREIQDREYAEALAEDEAKVHNVMCISVYEIWNIGAGENKDRGSWSQKK